jgi:8-oxo-dGTP pyrophosphatase MutT (NUDIX family)
MFRRSEKIEETKIVLIREFRSPADTEDGFVWEVPGGSSFKPKDNPMQLAAAECKEETGLVIDPARMRRHESRQFAATLSSHKGHLFSVEITDDELALVRSHMGIPHGVIEDTERTYVHILTLREILQSQKVDWSMLGMMLSVLLT